MIAPQTCNHTIYTRTLIGLCQVILSTKCSHGRMVSPLEFPQINVSKFGVIPKQ